MSTACGLLANGVYHDAWPSAALNLVWLVIGLAALTRSRTASQQALRQSTDSAGRDGSGVPH